MKRFIFFAVILILCLRGKAQNWVAPGGGYYNNILFNSLYADNLHNCLYNFGGDTNVLYNDHWYNWYPNTSVLRGVNGQVITFSDNKNYLFHHYYDSNNQKKSALVRWTNGSDLDTVAIYNGEYNMGNAFVLNNHFYVNASKDTTSPNFFYYFLSEFDGVHLLNQIPGGYSVVAFQNKLYGFTISQAGNVSLAVYQNNTWQVVSQNCINGSNKVIVKLLVYNNRLYIIGGFWKVEGSLGNSVMAWDGTRWDDLNGGIENYQLYLNGGANDAVVCNNKIYFVGPFDHAGGMLANKIVTWNDTSWCTIGGDLDSCYTISQVECFKDTIYIEGNLANVHGVNLGSIGKLVNLNYADSCKLIATGIRENKNVLSGIEISPNPASSKIKISFKSGEILKSRIYTSTGQLLYEQKEIRAGQDIDISALSTGIYFLVVENDTSRKTLKFVKE
ncbi:MAG: T9SS type A sorting domain-containing protein [Mucilaginibacter sp.]